MAAERAGARAGSATSVAAHQLREARVHEHAAAAAERGREYGAKTYSFLRGVVGSVAGQVETLARDNGIKVDLGAHKLRNSYAPVGSSGATRFDDENGAAGGGYSSDGLYNGGRGAHQASALTPASVGHSMLHALMQRPHGGLPASASPSRSRSAVGVNITHARAQGAHHEDMRQSPSRDASSDGGLRGGAGSRPGSADRAASRASPGHGAGGGGSHFAGFEADHEENGWGDDGGWVSAAKASPARGGEAGLPPKARPMPPAAATRSGSGGAAARARSGSSGSLRPQDKRETGDDDWGKW